MNTDSPRVLNLSDATGITGMPAMDAATLALIEYEDIEMDQDEELGSGNFASVFKGLYLGTEVAIKKIILPEEDMAIMKYIKREISLMNKVRHPNIVQFLGWCQPDFQNYLLLVEEYMKGGTLEKYFSHPSSKNKWLEKIDLCLDVARALLYLHRNKILFRDLKADNVLLDDKINPRLAKLCDFGLARTIDQYGKQNGPPMTICGTDQWMSPEVMLGMDYDERSDVFSFGVVLLECTVGTEVVNNQLERLPRSLFELDCEKARSFKPDTCPDELMDLALSCSSYEPNARPNFPEILIALANIKSALIAKKKDDDLQNELSNKLNAALNLNPQRFTKSTSVGTITQDPDRLVRRAELGMVSRSTSVRSSGSSSEVSPRDSPAASPPPERRIGVKVHSPSLSLSPSPSGSLLRQSLASPGQYVRVESMVQPQTFWNVLVVEGSTVGDICEKIAKKLDERYKSIKLYQIHGESKLKLQDDCPISEILSMWGQDAASYKIGVLYQHNTLSRSTTYAELGRLAKKDQPVQQKELKSRKGNLTLSISGKFRKSSPRKSITGLL